MHAAFSRLTERVLAHLGQDSFLREAPEPHRISIKHGVQFAGYGDESASRRGNGDYDLTVERSVAFIDKRLSPKVGDRLQHPDGDYDLDTLHADNGVMLQFILRKHVT
jgi:hypothetical protein